MRKSISIIIGFVLSGGLLYFAFKDVDIKIITQTFSKAKPVYLIILFASVFFEMCIRGFRWKMLVSHFAKTSIWKMTKLEAVGLALNNVIPLRLGEIARASLASHQLKASLFTVLSTVLVERLLDFITIIILFSVSVQFNGIAWLEKYKKIILIMFLVIVSLLFVLIFLKELINKNKIFSRIAGRFPTVKNFMLRVSMGAQSLKNKKLIVPVIISGFCLWLTDAFIYFFAFKSLDLEPAMDFIKAVVLLCGAAFATAIPAMPGYFGTFETAVQQILISWQTDKSVALAYGGYVHLIFYFVMTSAGILFLYQTGITLTDIWKDFSKKKIKPGNF